MENDQGNARGGGGSLHSGKGAKKKATQSMSLFTSSITGGVVKKRRLDGFFFRGVCFVCLVDPFGWLDRGRGMHTHD